MVVHSVWTDRSRGTVMVASCDMVIPRAGRAIVTNPSGEQLEVVLTEVSRSKQHRPGDSIALVTRSILDDEVELGATIRVLGRHI